MYTGGMHNHPNYDKSNSLMLTMSDDLRDNFRIYNNVYEKGAGDMDGLFWRMFYLSTATITTTGYGDIVPLTDLARGMVALESILGIVLIGLFINSFFRRD